ncbi:cilia- and flagella-associated protein 61-like [Ostrinia nubilalis]|uniref:cilia- and flagella-associated protein 61-like n=1 Tax=Ostrinia nubilalis TaxID=29057 RepID=UPI0030825E2F
MRTRSRGSINYNPKQKEEVETVVYHGEPNAFIIELFGFYEDIHDRHAFDLLEAAFEIMKNYDYCLIRVPCKDKTFPLLQHFCYVPTRPKICSKYALYVAHRSSVLGKLRVRPAEVVDVPQISQMLQNLEGKETIWTIENSILSNDNHSAFVFLSGFAIVGVGILESPEQIDFIRVKFNLDLYHNHKYHFRGQGTSAGFTTLKTVIAYPAFEVHYRYFAREMMRMTGTNSMLWLTAYRNKWVGHKANSLVSAMIPLIPRKSEIDCVEIPELKKISNLAQKITAFTTWFLGKNMTTIPKVDINVRILVVGASRTTMSFLDTLLFSDASSYLNFTNVTLISPNGLPYVRQAKPAAEMMFPRYRTTADKFLKSVPYTYYVNVVQGTMTEINKKEHYVTLSNGSVYFYDLLFLLLGKQYQHPNYLRELYERETEAEECKYTRLDVPRLYQESDIDLSTEYLPDNVFIINNISEANRALKYVKNFFWQDFNYKILVYGASIHAYCCLAALLDFQVPPENIVFIEPFPYENGKTRVPVFCNENVDESVKEVLNNLNITVYRSYYFQSWTVDGYNMVTHVDFLSHFQMVKLECTVLFYYGKTGVSTQALNGIEPGTSGFTTRPQRRLYSS